MATIRGSEGLVIPAQSRGHATRQSLPFAVIPVLYKYLPVDEAVSLFTNHEFWYCCPLRFEQWDCRVDLLENLDLDEARRALCQELEEFLCGATLPPAPYHPAGLLLQTLRTRQKPWTAREVEAEFGDLTADAFKDIDEHRSRIKEEQGSILRNVRVLCLSENKSSAEMWKQYSNKGRGVCIGFRYVAEIDNLLCEARRVKYVNEWPIIATPREWARHILFLERIPFGKRAVDALYIKLRQFSYEQEWRVITKPTPGTQADSDGVYRVAIDPTEVVEVILGTALSVDDRAKLCEAVQTFNPNVKMRHSRVECFEESPT